MNALSTNTICYEAIQRVYRNAVIRFARDKLITAYPAEWSVRLRKVFAKEWDSIVSSADQRRKTGELTVPVLDDLDYLGVNHFHNLFDAFFDVLFPSVSGETKEARKEKRNAILRFCSSVKALRDPLSHPGEEDFPYEDAFFFVDSARRILAHVDAEEACKLEELITRLPGHPRPERAALEHNLPPAETIALDFVGRTGELDQLRTWLTDPDKKTWALVGDGGKGKTAIAFEFARWVRDEAIEPFEWVVWLSTKKRRFLEGHIVPVSNPDFEDKDSAMDKLLDIFGWREDMGASQRRRVARLVEILWAFPALIVVDDVDSLEPQGEDAILFFTQDISQTKCKVLFTSRRSLFGWGAITTQVRGFDEGEGLLFIESRLRQFDLDPLAFSTSLRKTILTSTDGSPLFIEDLLRLSKTGYPVRDAIAKWRDTGGDEAREYALKREWELLTEAAKETLTACCIGDAPVSLLELVSITGRSEYQITSAVGELQRLFLMPTPKLIEQVERFDVNSNTRVLVRRVMENTDIARRVSNAIRALSKDLKLSATRSRKVGEYIRQAVFLVKNDRHVQAELMVKEGLKECPNDPELYGQLGWIYKNWKPSRRVTDARQSFRRAEQLICKQEEMYRHWCDMECEEQEWAQACNVAESAIKNLGDRPSLLFQLGYAKSRLGKSLVRELQPRGETELREAEKILRRALRDPQLLLSYADRRTNSRAYRALALTLETLLLVLRSRPNPETEPEAQRYCSTLCESLKSWLAEHPDDQFAITESERIAQKLDLQMN